LERFPVNFFFSQFKGLPVPTVDAPHLEIKNLMF